MIASSMTQTSSILATAWAASLWQGLALSLFAAAILRLMPRASAALRHTLLIAIFAAAVILPFLRLPFHASAMQSQAASAAIRLAPWFALTIAVAWIAASGLRAVSLGIAWFHLRNVRRNATPIAMEAVDGFSIGNRRAALCSSSEVSTPAVLGFFRPVLLLPEWLAPQLSPAELRQIALHECEHLRRRDDWINLALQVGLVLMPLNPALLWLNRRIGEQRELACDAAVIASTAQPIAYAASLTRIAEQRMQRNGLRLALAALERRSELAQRVHALLREPAAGWSSRQSVAACSLAAAALLFASAGLSRVPGMFRVAAATTPQTSVAVASPAEAVALYRNRAAASAAPAAHMVAASFEVKPVAKKHKVGHSNSVKPAKAIEAIAPKSVNAPHFLRTSAVEADQDQPSARRGARFVTTEFIQPYVAVPVQGGWLLIEL